jgi:CSLREA domain-containing protein
MFKFQPIWIVCSGVMLTLLAALALAGTPSAHAKPATTINVTTALDTTNPNDGLCSLREAINAINTSSASGPVAGECPAGAAGDSIALQATTYSITNASAGRINIGHSMTINGAGAASTVIHASGLNDGIFKIGSNTLAQINGVTISGGNAGLTKNSGGAFLVETPSSRLALNNSVVSNNISANGGGGIFSYGVVTLTNSTLQLNSATDDNSGGGIYNFQGAKLTLVNTDVLTNTSAFDGGGIFNHWNSQVTITGGNVISNTATQGGGGIANNYNSTTAISGTRFTKNAALGTVGGAVQNGNFATLTLTNADLNNNQAHHGGGIGTSITSTVTISNSAINANIATGDGGGILNSGNMTITNSSITNNHANTVYASMGGGGIYNLSALTITNSTISSNQGLNGGGILVNTTVTASVTANFVTIALNQATDMGGGIMNYANSGIVTLRNSIVAKNTDAFNSPNCVYTIGSLGFNLIENGEGCTFQTTTGDQVGTSANPLNPHLAVLWNYGGGATLTHALIENSPAIDRISNGTNTCGTTIATDQRGNARPHNTKCDIGAYEGWLTLKPFYLPLVLK